MIRTFVSRDFLSIEMSIFPTIQLPSPEDKGQQQQGTQKVAGLCPFPLCMSWKDSPQHWALISICNPDPKITVHFKTTTLSRIEKSRRNANCIKLPNYPSESFNLFSLTLPQVMNADFRRCLLTCKPNMLRMDSISA